VKSMTKLILEPEKQLKLNPVGYEIENKRRVVIMVLDGAGVGAMPDAVLYGDANASTIPNVSQIAGGLKLPQLTSLGLGNIAVVQGVPPSPSPRASFGTMGMSSPGKDTTTGHWELAGLVLQEPFPVYPGGFPPEVIEPFKESIGRDILGNQPASGTEIIQELGEKHLKTGFPIVYTSADSVFQVAAHEEIVPVSLLYDWCRIARSLLKGKHAVSRVIARPFEGKPGRFKRTERRKDFALSPPCSTLLDWVSRAGKEVAVVGKVKDIFNGKGVTRHIPAAGGNSAVTSGILEAMNKVKEGLIWANLGDFDTLYGHRNNAEGFARALEEFDRFLLLLSEYINPLDMMVITADHGCDPTWPGTDHTREFVPLLIWGDPVKKGVSLGTCTSLADLGATAMDYLQVRGTLDGDSFWDLIKK